jgi:DUF2075 family protein
MTCAWSGNISQLKSSIRFGRFLHEITSQFAEQFFEPTESEINAWNNSITALLSALDVPELDPLQIILELRMPVGAERADVVLLGGSPKQPRALVIELKQWSGYKVDPTSYEVDVPGVGSHQHPSIQALNYSGKLHFFNSRAHGYSLQAAVFLHNATQADIHALSIGKASEWTEKAPPFGRNNIKELGKFIKSWLLPVSLPDDEHITFASAPYEQSNQLFTFLQEHARDIASGAALAVANVGMGLTSEQELIINEVLRSASKKQQHDYLIQGEPGSGKTLLAVSLLLKAAEKKMSCILALRNNRLQAILRGIFDRVYPGISGMMMFFEPRQGQGIAQFQGHVDLLICDEAQRMESRIMPNVLQKATVSAIFLDETQRLNPPEQGTIDAFSKASRSVGRKPKTRYLSASVRVPVPYASWVDQLLTNPPNNQKLTLQDQPWHPGYIFNSYSSVEALIADLRKLRGPDDRVAMVASFTESPGDMKVDAPDNLRIGYPLPSGFDLYKKSKLNIPWLMSTSHYKQFWIGGNSNNLDRLASIYGAQGFESDYVGVIWGRDLIFRHGRWVLGDPNVCYDAIDRLTTGRSPNRRWSPEALELVINRYRIFLTRGIKGTLVFCEDPETRKYFTLLIHA